MDKHSTNTRRSRETGGARDSDSHSSENRVELRGRVAAPADERELPSGDTIMMTRIIVDRDQSARAVSRQRVDTIDCVAWKARVQRTVRSWQAGDVVRVEGSIRRRFFRGPSGPVSRFEVELKGARRLRKATVVRA
ncbi:MAG: single-stranded DNA-binding protein [Nocardioidaceae bacterium]